ncbi:MAG: hypothetical protein RR197_01735, partial [Oscillospiraceae bacterium]
DEAAASYTIATKNGEPMMKLARDIQAELDMGMGAAPTEEELELLRAVERCARLSVTGLVNNTNLGVETAPEHLRGSLEYLEQVSQRSGLPVLLTAACARAAEALEGAPSLFPVEIYVKTPW